MEDGIIDAESITIGLAIGLVIGICFMFIFLFCCCRKKSPSGVTKNAESGDEYPIHSMQNAAYGRETFMIRPLETETSSLYAKPVALYDDSSRARGECATCTIGTQTDMNIVTANVEVPCTSDDRIRREKYLRIDVSNPDYVNEIHMMYQNMLESLKRSSSCNCYENKECIKHMSLSQLLLTTEEKKSTPDVKATEGASREVLTSDSENNYVDPNPIILTMETSDMDTTEEAGGEVFTSDSENNYVDPNQIIQNSTSDDSDSDNEQVDGKLMAYVSTLKRNIPKRSVSQFVKSPWKSSDMDMETVGNGGYVTMNSSSNQWTVTNNNGRKLIRAKSAIVDHDEDPYLKMNSVGGSTGTDDTYIEIIS